MRISPIIIPHRIAGLKTDTGEGAIYAAALTQVWAEVDMLFSEKPLTEDKEATERDIKLMELAVNKACLMKFDDYSRACRTFYAWLTGNYKRRLFKAHDLRNIRPLLETEGDPLCKTTAKGHVDPKQVPDDVYKFDPSSNSYKKIDSGYSSAEIAATELNWKKYNRRHLLYCNAEAEVANFALETAMPDKPIWSNQTTQTLRNLVLRYGMDPSANRRMKLDVFELKERELRQIVLTGLRDGKWPTWDNGLADSEVKQFITMEFRLREVVEAPAKAPPATPTRETGKGKDRYQPYTPAKPAKGKGKGKGKSPKPTPEPPFQAPPTGKDCYLQRDATTGSGYCIPWNLNRPCKCDNTMASTSCPFIHKCNWAKCKNRDACKGSSWHKQNPGKGVHQ